MKGAAGLHVLMTADAVGGVWSYALDLAEGLAAHGVRTTLAVLGPAPEPDQRAAATAVPGLTLRVTDLPLEWLAGEPAAVEAAGAAVAAMATEAGVDLVHLNSPALAASACFGMPVVAICHSCVATWWRTMRTGAMPEDFAWRAALTARGLAAATERVAPTAAFAAATAEAYRLQRPPVAVYNGRRAASTGDVPEAPFVFTAGRLWDEGKNLKALDRAAALLEVPVLAAGPTHGPHGVSANFRHLRPLGRLSGMEMRHWLARGPVFASLARYEPFGLAVLEAAQAGCALVLSDIPSFRELWDGAAEFVPPEDEQAAAHALGRMLGDRERRAAHRVAARERARRYSVEAMAAGVLGVYGQALHGAGSYRGREAAA